MQGDKDNISLNENISFEKSAEKEDMVNPKTELGNDSKGGSTNVKQKEESNERMDDEEENKKANENEHNNNVNADATSEKKEGAVLSNEQNAYDKKSIETEKDSKNMKQSISSKIEANMCYEAHHMIKTSINRTLKKKDVDKCIKIILHYCPQFAKKKEYIFICDLMVECVNILKEHNVKFTTHCAEKIIEIFKLFPPKSTEEKYKFLNKAIVWSKSETTPYGYLPFHTAVGTAYLEDGKYDLAHNHFIYTDNSQKLYEALSAWQKEGYPSEAPYFTLRSVLSLILLKKFDVAFDIINYDEQDLWRKDVPLPIQVAYLINSACACNAPDFYEEVKYRYRLILNVDPEFQNYLKEIDSLIFKKQKKDIFSFFQNMFK